MSVKRADGSLKPSDQLLGEIADKFADLPNGPEKAAIAMDIFGRSGSKLITMLNGGSEALERFNYETSVNFAQNAEYFNDQISILQIQFDGFRKQLADALLPALNAILEVFSDLFDSGQDFTPLFQVIEAGIRGVASVVLGLVQATRFFVRTLQDLVKIATLVGQGKFGEAFDVAKTGLADTRAQFFKDIAAQGKTLFGRSEVGVDYGGGGAGLDPVTLQGGGTGTGTNGKPAVQVSADVLRLTKEINAARLAGNKLAEVDLGYDLAIQQLKEKGLTGNNLALEQSNLLTQYTLERLDAVNGLTDAQDNLNDKTDKYKITLDQVKDTLANQITSAIEGLIDGTKSLGESLSGLLKHLPACSCVQALGHWLSQIFPSAKGNVFAQNGIVPYAKGGYIGRPTMALMGEAGPEAVLPLRRGRGGRLGVETSGGGVGNVVVNVDASGSSVQGNEPDANQLGRVIGQAVQS